MIVASVRRVGELLESNSSESRLESDHVQVIYKGAWCFGLGIDKR
jgi:hypothetical protein